MRLSHPNHDIRGTLCYTSIIIYVYPKGGTAVQIRHMTATFGKLHRAALELQPGLNIIYAPNESGKSTWCQFLRTMFYGLPTRERGPLADKNRYAPWDGAAMSGMMELEQDGRHYTITRTTSRPNAPMGDFHCTYTGTADAVPGIDSHNCGEELLGVERSVFTRSTFIGQSGLAVDKDAELERRIASLITSGDETTSYTDTCERLKKQRNRRRHNKTGLLPAIEAEIAQLDEALSQYDALTSQYDAAQTQLQQTTRQVEELQQAQAQYDRLSRQEAVRRCQQAQAQADAAHDLCLQIEERDAAIPSERELGQLLGMADALEHNLQDRDSTRQEAHQFREEAERAQQVWHAHPLYPATEEELSAPTAPASAPFSPAPLLIALFCGIAIGGIAIGAILWFTTHSVAAACGAGFALAAILSTILYSIGRRRAPAQRRDDADAYLTLLRRAKAADEAAQSSASAAVRLQRSCQDGMLLLLSRVQPFRPQAMDLTTSRAAIHDALRCRQELKDAQQQAQDADFQVRLLRSQLPAGDLPAWDAVLPRPVISELQIENALPLALARRDSAQQQLQRLTGQRTALGQRDPLQRQRDEKEHQRQQLQQEYDALTVAITALEEAHAALQSRFSPALGQRAAEIFRQLTGGKYDAVLMDRDFSLSAQTEDDLTAHSIQLLSQGAADQLYLAVRLAICDLILPADKATPLVLDDALCSFDDERMALALDYLTQLSSQRQILLFTCQRREADLLKNRENVSVICL